MLQKSPGEAANLGRPGLKGDELGLWGREATNLEQNSNSGQEEKQQVLCQKDEPVRKEDQVMPWQW